MVVLVLFDINNLFYFEFVCVVECVVWYCNYFLMVCNIDECFDIGCVYLYQIVGMLVDGVLVLYIGISVDDINVLKMCCFFIVLVFEEKVDLVDQILYVVVNFYCVGEIVGQYLLMLGYWCMGVIVGCGLEGMQIGWFEGFCDVLYVVGVVLLDVVICNVSDIVVGGYDVVVLLLEQYFDFIVIFCINDLMVYGVLQVLVDWGIYIL